MVVVQRLYYMAKETHTFLGVYTGKWDLMMHANLVITNTNVNSHKKSLELVSVCAGKGAVVLDEHEDTNEKNRCSTLNF